VARIIRYRRRRHIPCHIRGLGLVTAFLLAYPTSPTRRYNDACTSSWTKARACTRCADGCSSPTKSHVRRRHHSEQTDQALCLTVVTNAVVLFNTVYLQHALDALRQRGHNVDGHAAAHLSPALHEHINPYGSYSFDIERELGRTDLRPLRDPP